MPWVLRKFTRLKLLIIALTEGNAFGAYYEEDKYVNRIRCYKLIFHSKCRIACKMFLNYWEKQVYMFSFDENKKYVMVEILDSPFLKLDWSQGIVCQIKVGVLILFAFVCKVYYYTVYYHKHINWVQSYTTQMNVRKYGIMCHFSFDTLFTFPSSCKLLRKFFFIFYLSSFLFYFTYEKEGRSIYNDTCWS